MKNIALVALLLPAVALANGYDVPNVNPRDLALGGSADAAQNDAAATFAMPAALARLGEGLDLSLSGSALEIDTTWNDTTGGQLGPSPARTLFHPAPPVSLFASYGFTLDGHPAGVGIGMNVAAGGNVFWPDDWAGAGRIITVDRKIYGFYLTGGYQLIPQLRIGGGLVYYYGTEYLKQAIQPFPGAFGELSTSGGALAFDLSAEATPFDSIPLTVAADFKYQGAMTLTGNAHYSVPASVQPSVQDQGVTHDLTYPSVLNVALAYRIAPPVLLTFGFTYNWYDVYKSDVFAGSAGTTITVPRNYGDGHTFRAGLEWSATDQLTVRVGGERDISGLNPADYSPTLPDSDAYVAAGGLGWKFTPTFEVSATFFHAWLDSITSIGPTAFPGHYSTSVWIASAGVSWKLGDGAKQ